MNLDEVAHNEPPHQDLRCLQIQLFSSLVVKELIVLTIQSYSFTEYHCQKSIPFCSTG